MHPIVKPLGILLIITFLMSGLTSISDNSPGLAPNPTDDRHENTYSEWEDTNTISSDNSIGIKASSSRGGNGNAGDSENADDSGDSDDPILPVANFSATPLSGVAPLEVTFTDLSANASTISWDVNGDGIEDSNASVFVYIYDEVGLYNVSLTATNENGSVTKAVANYINVSSSGGSGDDSGDSDDPVLPVANFTATPLSGVAPLKVTFTDLSANATTISWDVNGDGVEDSNASVFVYIYDEVGLYNVSLTATNENGSVTKAVANYINVSSSGGSGDDSGDDSGDSDDPVLPVANFTATPLSGVDPLEVTFTDLSANATTISWDVNGDGIEDSNATEFVYTYDEAGLYNVSLTATNENGSDIKTVANYINVTSPSGSGDSDDPILPVANFSATPLSGVAPLEVTFTDLSANATTISWDVNGDGIEDSNATEFVYTYDEAGLYNVSLTATNENGSDIKTVANYINVTSPSGSGDSDDPILPVANFSATPLSGVAPLEVTFTDLSANATTISWDVNGDGIEDSNASVFVYIYDEAGLYNVSLTATNENGSDIKTVANYINVTSPGGSSNSDDPVLPVANFSATPLSGVAPLEVTFTDLSANATTISWDVNGDGVEDSNATEFVYTYDEAGLYNVSLTATNENGSDIKTVANYINVTSPSGSGDSDDPILPVANFSATPLSGVAPLEVNFTDLSANATTISWDVNGDGVEDSNASVFVYIYDESGLYNVSLTATNENGSVTKAVANYINVSSSGGSGDDSGDSDDPVLPVANFSATPLSGVAPLEVTFTDLSANATTISWDVNGDGVEDSNASVFVYIYDEVGLYNVSLTATNENGSDIKTVANYINVSSSGGSGDIDDLGFKRPKYWMNNPNKWPVNEITIGGVTYSKNAAIQHMKHSGDNDKTYFLFEELVAAKLNFLIGNPYDVCEETAGYDFIAAADNWMAINGPVGNNVYPNSKEWKNSGKDYWKLLKDCNKGNLVRSPTSL